MWFCSSQSQQTAVPGKLFKQHRADPNLPLVQCKPRNKWRIQWLYHRAVITAYLLGVRLGYMASLCCKKINPTYSDGFNFWTTPGKPYRQLWNRAELVWFLLSHTTDLTKRDSRWVFFDSRYVKQPWKFCLLFFSMWTEIDQWCILIYHQLSSADFSYCWSSSGWKHKTVALCQVRPFIHQ